MRLTILWLCVAIGGCESTLDLQRGDAGVILDRPRAREVWLPSEDDAGLDESLVDPYDDVALATVVTVAKETRCDGRDDPDDAPDDGVDEGCPYAVADCRTCAPPLMPESMRFRVARTAALGGGFALGVWREGFMQDDNRMMFSLARVDAAGLAPVRSGLLQPGVDEAQPAAFASAVRLPDRFLTIWAPPARRCVEGTCRIGVAAIDDEGALAGSATLSAGGYTVSNLIASDAVVQGGRGALLGVVSASSNEVMLHRIAPNTNEAGPARPLDLGVDSGVLDLRAVAYRGEIAWVFVRLEGRRTPVYLARTDVEGRRASDPVQLLPWGRFPSETQGGVMLAAGRVVVSALVPDRGLVLTSWAPETGPAPPVLIAAEPNLLSVAGDGASVFTCHCAAFVCSVRRLSPAGGRLGDDTSLRRNFSECELAADQGRVLAALGDYGMYLNPYLALVAPRAP